MGALPQRDSFARRGAQLGAIAATLCVGGMLGAWIRSPFGPVADVGVAIAVAAAAIAVVAVGVRSVSLLAPAIRRGPSAIVVASALVCSAILFERHVEGPSALVGGVLHVLSWASLGWVVGSIASSGEQGGWRRNVGRLLLLAFGVAVTSTGGWLLFSAGSSDHLVPTGMRSSADGSPSAAGIGYGDPTAHGPFTVNTLTYGSGTDLRPEYGGLATLTTRPLDVTWMSRERDDWRGVIRDTYWGFGPREFPLNGRVWVPEKAGRSPLVLMVHGNYAMTVPSEFGYDYLGELLASRGYIVASIDQNFLNGWSVTAAWGDSRLRSFMLLAHLEQWARWNTDVTSPFLGRIDLKRIALIGHSRGGEAAAQATAMNALARDPSDGSRPLGKGLGIRSVVALAPTDWGYQVGDRRTVLEDVNYLVIQGGHDANAPYFVGDRQYSRAALTDRTKRRMKAAVFLYRANHSQFNVDWGDADRPPPMGWMLNRRAIMPGEEQRRVTASLVSAFLDATLRGSREATLLFRDDRSLVDWLGPEVLLSRRSDSTFRLVAGFEEDVDPSTATVTGAEIRGEGFTIWREGDLRFRDGLKRGNNALLLGWHAADTRGPASPVYSIELPHSQAGVWNLSDEDSLVFEMTSALPFSADTAGAGGDDGVDLTIRLSTSDGLDVGVPLRAFGRLLPPLRMRLMKLDRFDAAFGRESESVLQAFRIPLSAFVDIEPAFVPGKISGISFVASSGTVGEVILDNVGFSGPL